MREERERNEERKKETAFPFLVVSWLLSNAQKVEKCFFFVS